MSMTRLNKFLQNDELQESAVKRDHRPPAGNLAEHSSICTAM